VGGGGLDAFILDNGFYLLKIFLAKKHLSVLSSNNFKNSKLLSKFIPKLCVVFI